MTKVKIAIVSDFYEEQVLEFVEHFKSKASEFEFIYTGKKENFSFWNYFKTIYFVVSLDLSKYDQVVSLSSGIAHGLVTNLDTNHINFELDSEFNETIHVRGVNKLTYNSFSEGEKLRIDLSLILAWREISLLQSGMSSNLLFFDEI